MGKTARLARSLIRKEFVIGFGGTFFAILGMVATVLAIADWRLGWAQSLLVAAIGLIASGWMNWRKLLPPQVAIDDALAYSPEGAPLRRLRCPCDIRLARQATLLAQKCFAGSVTIAPNEYEQLRVKNSLILTCLTDDRGHLLGYFDIIPLRESFAVPFLSGSVTEEQITHEDVLSPEEMASCRYLFIAGIAVDSPDTQQGKWNASIAVWGLLRYLAKFYPTAEPMVFAVAATKEGDALLKKFDLHLDADACTRRDRYCLYSLQLSAREISTRLASLPDWSNLCVADWDTRASPSKPGSRVLRPVLPTTNVVSLEFGEARARQRRTFGP